MPYIGEDVRRQARAVSGAMIDVLVRSWAGPPPLPVYAVQISFAVQNPDAARAGDEIHFHFEQAGYPGAEVGLRRSVRRYFRELPRSEEDRDG